MNNKLEKKFGLMTAISMVVGIVIGSGIFFKAEAILAKTNNNLLLGLISILAGGLIIIICSNTFAVLGSKYEKVNGVVDYAEATLGSNYAYLLAWFMTNIYTPCIASVLAWVSARYFCELIGFENAVAGPECMLIAGGFLVLSYVLNALAPKLSSKLLVSATFIKLVPLVTMAVVGTIIGIANGNLANNFSQTGDAVAGATAAASGNNFELLLGAIISMAFSYEGWILATSINAELKNAKRNLPLALTIGSVIIVAVYAFYYIGIAGGVPSLEGLSSAMAFENIFGKVFGKILTAFIVVSCLGTLNGLMISGTRSMYSIAIRRRGPAPDMFESVDKQTGMPMASSAWGLLTALFWLVYFLGSQIFGWFGNFGFDSSELPIVALYAAYIPMFISIMIKNKEMGFVKRFLLPGLSIICSAFMVYAAIASHKMKVVYFLIMFAVIMALSLFFYKPKAKKEEVNEESADKASE